jgi:endonuclease/exonuclease/phosphatase family metal-dependent hydrolase
MKRISFTIAMLLAGCGHTTPVVFTSLASVPRAQRAPIAATDTFRVVSYNLNFGMAGDPPTIAAITSVAPDLIFLQESNDVWEQSIVADVPSFPHRRFVAPHRMPAGGMGMLSKYPITSVQELASDGGPFFALRAVIATPRGPLQVLNVHLRPPMSDGGSWVVGYFSTRETREHEIASHLAQLDPALPTLIVGDFNEETGNGLAIKTANEHGFVDAIHQFVGDNRTWEWPVGSITLRMQLDHILYDSRLIVAGAGIVEGGRSDHKPVWADVAM